MYTSRNTEDVMEDMRHSFRLYIRPLKDYLSLMTSTNIRPGVFINAMIMLASHRAAGHFSHYVYHGHRAHQGHRRSEIARRKSLVRYRALLSESAALCLLGNWCGIGLSYLVRAGFV